MIKYYATEEIAEKLRAKGYYREYCLTDEWVDGLFYQVEDGTFYLPRIDEVLAWLREEKKIHICISMYEYTWGYTVYDLDTFFPEEFSSYYNTYEEATLAGIEYVINYLI